MEASGEFTTKSLYRLMKNSGEIDLRMIELWKTKLPLKIRIFYACFGTIEYKLVINSKSGRATVSIVGLETRNHLFFNCHIAQVIWVGVRISIRWSERPTLIQHFEDMMGIGLGPIRDSSIFFILASVVWSLWKTRNGWVFNNQLIKSPKVVALKIMGFMSQWKKLLKPEEMLKMEDTIKKLQRRPAGVVNLIV